MSVWNICSLTGNPIEEPVISKKTGHVFEKKIIEKHIESMGTCPITGQDLALEDLLPLQMSKLHKPRPTNATSIPSMLTIFQTEWDSVMLEVYTLKQHLETVRQELSHALYQHDAACRVISRVIKERDEARQQLSQLQNQLASFQNNIEIEEKEQQQQTLLPEKILNDVNDTAIHLNSKRKEQRKKKDAAFAEFANLNTVSKFNLKSDYTAESSILCLDIDKQDRYVAFGCENNNSYIQDIQQNKIIGCLEGHTQKINELQFLSSSEDNLKIFSCSDDSTANLFQYNIKNNNFAIKYTVKSHKAAITSLDIHPIGYMAVTCGKDNSWSFHDLNQGKELGAINDFDVNLQFQSIKFHPDGHLLGTGANDGTIKIWNITDDSLVATLEGHKGIVDKIAFSENGYYLASKSTQDQVVKIWDLRHLKIVHEIDSAGLKIGNINFDPSGQYLGIGIGNGLKLYNTKTWDAFTSFQGHKDIVTSFKFGGFSKFLITGSLDKNLNIYS